MFRILVSGLMLLWWGLGLSAALGPYLLVPLDGLGFGIDQAATPEAPRGIGTNRPPPEQQPALLTEAGLIPLGTLPGGTFGLGSGICGAFATGYSGTGPFSLRTHAFRWTQADGPVDLGTTGSEDLFSAGSDVNCLGVVAGRGDDPTGSRIVPLVWDADGLVRQLPTFEAIGSAFANAINALGDVTGDAQVGRGAHCALWPHDTGEIVDCDPGSGTDGFSFGFDINASRHIVGSAIVPTLGQRGFLVEATGEIVLLAPLGGEAMSMAAAINDAGLAVGASSTDPPVASAPFSSQCTLWQDTQEPGPPAPVALASLVTNPEGWDVRRCVDISEAGVILGEGTLNGVPTAFFAIPMGMVAQPPPVEEPPVADARAPRHHRLAQHRDLDLHARLARWQQHREVYLSKQARWNERVAEWKARHGEQ
jgi:hypothetical protein